jgi:hypothetical protein
VKSASKSVFTLKTFSADGSLIASSNGFFTGNNGEAISSFTPFKGAVRAVIIDAAGKEMNVSGMIGANDMYDVAKFRVVGKTRPLTVASGIAQSGERTWLLPYLETKNLSNGIVRKAETFQQDYAYYTIAMQAQEKHIGSPLLNDNGEVIGILQPAASGADSLCYAISALFADSLKVTGLSINDPTLKLTQIRTEMPESLEDANLMMYLAGASTDSTTYTRLISDFIQKFPAAPDGYAYRAQFASSYGDFASAEKDMEEAIKLSTNKDNEHFNYARMIYNKEIYQANKPYENWSLDKALSETHEAWNINPVPAYRELEANILYTQKNYAEAYDRFIELTKTNMVTAETWYCAALCKGQLKDTTAMLALLDSTMNMFSKPYLKQAAPYLWARANAKFNSKKYREAVNDMNDYEQLMAADVNANFYYIRHQAEVEGRLFQQALNDIGQAAKMEPKNTFYLAEKASLQLRVGLYDQVMETANEIMTLEPDNSDGYLFLGLSQCMKGKKKEGLTNLQKAKELGYPQADELIEKYAK